MNAAKIRLSAEEEALVSNADWILTKNGILRKVNLLLADLQLAQKELLDAFANRLPPEVGASTPKISKGENYRGLPYQVLDYPRYFDKQDIFVIRSLFWWGNFFSITLQLSGRYKVLKEQQIIAAWPLLQQEDYFICISEDPWEHHFEADNYRAAAAMQQEEFQAVIANSSFIKISKKISLHHWQDAGNKLNKNFRELIQLVAG